MTTVMTKVTNRQVDRSELKGRIFAAAIFEFRANGYSGATIDAITKRAKVAKGTFFNFYRSKTDVLAEYYHLIDVRLAPLRSKLDPSKPLESLVGYAKGVERELNQEGPLAVDLVIELMRDDAMSAVDARSGDNDLEQFAKFFQGAKAAGQVKKDVDARVAAATYMDLWAGSVREWVRGKRTGPLSNILSEKLSIAFRGIASRGSKHEP